MIAGGAWGAGLATFSGDRILEVFYPDPRLGTSDESAEPLGAELTDERRGTRQAPVITVIADLSQPPDGAA